MNPNDAKKSPDPALRAHAEAQLANSLPPEVPAEELLYELRVHQVELEMQNEALRQSQQALEESRDRFVDLYEFAPVGYLTLSAEGMITEINLTAVMLLRQERNTLFNKSLRSLVIAADQDRWVLHFMALKKQPEKRNIELSLQRGDGMVFHAQLDCVGNAAMVRITLSDITERKLIEATLFQSEAKLRTVMETMVDGLVTVDATGVITYANPAAGTILSLSKESVSGKYFQSREWQQVDQEGNPFPQEQLPLAIALGECREVSNVVHAIVTSNEEYKWLSVNAAPLFDEVGVLVGALATFRDVTDIRKAEEELRIAAIEEQREEDRKRIAREVHDELGQILTALRMDVALINLRFGEQNAELVAKTKGMTELLNRGGQCVHDIVSNLRPAALETGIVSAVDWLCKEFALHTGASCVLHSSVVAIDLDEGRTVAIFRIVQELLTNAARHAEARNVKVSLSQHADELHIQVRDDGKGFVPATVTTKKSYGLLGIKERALALGGNIDIVSAPNQGTAVTVIVPVKPNGENV